MSDSDVVKNLSLMFGALIALAVVIFIVANIIGAKPVTTSSADDESVVARIEPIGKLVVVKAVSAVANAVIPSAQAAADGAAVYNTACAACHGAGIAGSPRLGDKAAWMPRIKQGKTALYASSLKGKGAMPPKGGRTDMSDDAIKAAVDYMISKSK